MKKGASALKQASKIHQFETMEHTHTHKLGTFLRISLHVLARSSNIHKAILRLSATRISSFCRSVYIVTCPLFKASGNFEIVIQPIWSISDSIRDLKLICYKSKHPFSKMFDRNMLLTIQYYSCHSPPTNNQCFVQQSDNSPQVPVNSRKHRMHSV